MRPSSLPLFTLLLTLLLPVSAMGARPTLNKLTHNQIDSMRYASKPNAINTSSSASSAPQLVTLRSKDTGISFRAPDNWKVAYDPSGITIYTFHNIPLQQNHSTIYVTRGLLSKKQTWTNEKIFNTFMQNVTMDTSVDRIFPDVYLPSFKLTASGTVTVKGQKALSVSYTGEYQSTTLTFRRISIISGPWLYTLYLSSLPEYAAADSQVFDGVVGSFAVETVKSSSSSMSSQSSSRMRHK